MQNDFEELNNLYHNNFSLGFISEDFSTKVALISLLGYLVLKLKAKDPSISYLKVIKSLSKGMKLDPKFIYTLAIIYIGDNCKWITIILFKPNTRI